MLFHIFAFSSWFLYVFWLGIKPTILAYQDDALTYWAIWPGHSFEFIYLFIYFEKYFIYLFLERGEGREKKRERNTDVLEINLPVESHLPPTEDLTQTQACALTGNRTSNLSVCRLALSPLSHTSQGRAMNLNAADVLWLYCNACFVKLLF